MGEIIKRFFLFIGISGALCLLNSCGDEGCTEATTSYTVASLVKESTASSIAAKTISVYGIGQKSDSAMVLSQTDFKVISLLLNPDTTCTKMNFVFAFAEADTIRDTLSFYYKNQAYFLTIDCGCTVENYIDSILHTSHLIKKVEIINPEVKNEKKPNITLYY